jgi:hypothetical protein
VLVTRGKAVIAEERCGRHEACLREKGAGHVDVRQRRGHAANKRLLAVLLNAGGPQTSKAVAVDRVLPSQEFLDSQRIAAAGLLERKKASAHGRNDFRFSSNHPAFRSRRWKVGNRKRTSIGPDNVLRPRAVGLVHTTLTHLQD